MRAMVPLKRGGWSLTAAESNNKKRSRRRLNQEPQWHGERKSGCRKDKRSPARQEPDQQSRWEKRKGNGRKGGKSCLSGAGRKQVGRYREVTAERSREPWLDAPGRKTLDGDQQSSFGWVATMLLSAWPRRATRVCFLFQPLACIGSTEGKTHRKFGGTNLRYSLNSCTGVGGVGVTGLG